MLTIDDREKNMELVDAVQDIAIERGYDVDFQRLPLGDYYWDDINVVIEHKECKDFIGSMMSGRLRSQMFDLQQHSRAFLFIEGQWPYGSMFGRLRLTQKIVAGLVTAVMVEFPNVAVFHWPTHTMFAQAVVSLRNRYDDSTVATETLVRRAPTSVLQESPNYGMYLSIPKIGPKTAKFLADEYPTMEEMFEAFREDERIIPKQARDFVRALLKPR